MGNPQDHIADTLKTVRGTASDEDIALIQDVVDLVIDGQDTAKSKNALESILSRSKKYEITVDSLYQDLLKSGVDPKEIELPIYNNDKREFLKKWFLPPHGPSHQMYTHKGWKHDYNPEDGDDWSGQAKNQSWEVKKKLLVDISKKIYPSSDAEKVAVTLYNVHRLRDLQCNGTEKQKPGEHLKNIPDELEKYTLPLIKDENRRQKFAEEIANLRSEIKDYYENYFTKGYNVNINNPLYKHVNRLIGSLEGNNGGMLGDIYTKTVSPGINTPMSQDKKSETSSPKPPKSGGVGSGFGGGRIGGGTLPPIDFRIIGIIVGIILLILLILFLLRNCHGCSGSPVPPPPPTTQPEPPPLPPPPPPPRFSEKTEMLFKANSSELLPSALNWLDRVAIDLSKYIEQNPDAMFQVEGYAAVYPGFPDPKSLSQERANKIISELGIRKINVNKLQAVSGGETSRWGNNIDESTRAPNRRIVIQQK